MKHWLVATYKTKEAKRLEFNLSNQKFDYYLPKITKKNLNSKPKEELLFPGYVFVNTSFKNYSTLRYTIGIKNVIKFGDNISYISNEEIKTIQMVEESSKIHPLTKELQAGQEVIIKEGSLKGTIVKICSLPSKERANVLINFLGSTRRINISKRNLIFKKNVYK